jgi:Zn-finger nucleic acid-binding protein
MNCERFLMVAADLARNQVVDASERESARVHVDQCDDCRRAWNDQLELSERLRKLADQTTSSRAPEHVEAQLLAAFRDRTRVVTIHSTPRRRRYWMTAAAAVVLMVFGLLAWRSHVASLRQPQVQVSSKSVTAPASDSPKQAQSQTVAVTGTRSSTQPLIKPALSKSLSRRHPASSQLAKSDAAKQSTVEQTSVLATSAETKELATDFVLVGYGNALDLQDGGQLVRVELPRSALARFGLPMNMDRVDERIKADVLVGTDGLARAIRFVEVKAIKN